MRLKDFSAANRARSEHPQGFNHSISDWAPEDWLVAVVGEFGEAANVVKKLKRERDGFRGNKETPTQLVEMLKCEIADVFIYLDLFAQSVGVDLSEAVIATFNRKSEEIGYPTRLTHDASPQWTDRLAHIERRTEIEKLAAALHDQIEDLGAHPLLTDASMAAYRAICILGKWHDEGEPGRDDMSHKA